MQLSIIKRGAAADKVLRGPFFYCFRPAEMVE